MNPSTLTHVTGPNDFAQGAGLTPQQWWQVVAADPKIAKRCQQLVPALRELTPIELEQLVAAIAADKSLWRDLVVVDPNRRRYRLMLENEFLDVWVLSWMPDQATGYHDHDDSSVGWACAQGEVVERQMTLPVGATTRRVHPGQARSGPAGYIHAVRHGIGEPAVTIHAYSPPLTTVGQYKVDEAGILQRSIEHGRQELIDHTIAAIDPSRS